MAVLNIYDVNQSCLRAKARRVSRITPSEQKLLDDMVETMLEARGIGLAANQVGVLQRLVTIELDDVLYKLVNPELEDLSDETEVGDEGCLSLPYYYGPVERSVKVTVRAMDDRGKRIKIKADGMLARVLQHEIDHLDGVLFFDPSRMRSLNDLRYEPPRPEGEEPEAISNGEETNPPERRRRRAESSPSAEGRLDASMNDGPREAITTAA